MGEECPEWKDIIHPFRHPMETIETFIIHSFTHDLALLLCSVEPLSSSCLCHHVGNIHNVRIGQQQITNLKDYFVLNLRLKVATVRLFVNPLVAISIAITRRFLKGKPIGMTVMARVLP